MQKFGFTLIFVLIIGCFSPIKSQSGITFFVNSELDRILDMAKRENKDVFVDTYTQWCVPCKKLDKVFTDRELGSYFNDNFINVKFDMETKAGKVLVNKYDVFFMPTLLILDKHGNIKLKWDQGLVDAQQLLNMAIRTEHPELYAAQNTQTSTPVRQNTTVASAPIVKSKPKNTIDVPEGHEMVIEKNPVTGSTIVTTRPIGESQDVVVQETTTPKPTPPKREISQPVKQETKPEKQVFTKQDISSDQNEKILYVMDSGEGPPDFILYEEAYFRLQLMDGSQNKAAKAYLQTQSDWLTEKNMRFLNDFLYTTNSEEFEFYIEHRAAFETLLGPDQVLKTIIILGNNRLERGFPSPTFEEAKELYTLMRYAEPIKLANRYNLDRLYHQDAPQKYIDYAKEYCDQTGKADHFEMNRLAIARASTDTGKKSLKKAIKLLNKAIELEPNNFEYFESLAYVHYKMNNQSKAKQYILDAKAIAEAEGKQDQLNTDIHKLIQTN